MAVLTRPPALAPPAVERGSEHASSGPRAPSGWFDQFRIGAAQLTAGVGNLAFSLLLARLLAPGAFAQVSAFLALYLLLHLPATSLVAGGAVAPRRARRLQPPVLVGGLLVGILLAVGASRLAGAFGVPIDLVVALAAAAPAAGLLSLLRGRLYGTRRHGGVAACLLIEPAVRLLVGLGLALTFGAAGAALGVVLAGWAVLPLAAVLLQRPRVPEVAPELVRTQTAPPSARGERRPLPAVLSFLGLAVLQTQDLLIANRLLPGAEAGQFATLSTLGGVAVFTTATLPFVLLSGGERSRDGVAPAVVIAVIVGVATTAVAWLFPEPLLTLAFGERYVTVAPLVGPYMLAMALLGVGRVLVAERLASGGRVGMVVLLVAVASVQATLLVTGTASPARAVLATLVASAVLTGTLTARSGVTALLRTRIPRRLVDSPQARQVRGGRWNLFGQAYGDHEAPPARRQPSLWARLRGSPRTLFLVGGLAVLGLVLRLLTTRGLWLDEATSIAQAQLPFTAMLDEVRYGDVHPPLHHAVLWVVVRLLGTGELAVRLPVGRRRHAAHPRPVPRGA